MKNPYVLMTKEELNNIYKDIINSKKEGKRIESFVPYAQEIKENIGGDFTLLEAIDWAKTDYFNEIAKRFFSC